MIENLLQFIDIKEIIDDKKFINMIDIAVEDDESFLLDNGIISHNSAAGSIKQARNSETDGVYALKGKVKNAKRLSDLTSNIELLEIISILGLDPTELKTPLYKNIIIATDEDCIDENTEIKTTLGFKKIKDITYNDIIVTHNGISKILKIIETDKEEYMEIEILQDKLKCSLNNTLLIVRDGKTYEISANELKITDFIICSNN